MPAPTRTTKPATPAKPTPAPIVKPSEPAARSPSAKSGDQTAEVAPGVMELKGMGPDFKPPAAVAGFLDGRKLSTVNVKFGSLAQGPIEVRTEKPGRYVFRQQRIPLSHPLFSRIAEAAPGLAPCLVLNAPDGKLQGKAGLAAGAKLDSLESQLAKAPEILGLAGFRPKSGISLVNKIEGGNLQVGAKDIAVNFADIFSATVSIMMVNEKVDFEGGADIKVKGLAQGKLDFKRTAEGLITGAVDIAVNLNKNINGSVKVSWDGQAITGEGKAGYTGEKLSGNVTLNLMEKGAADKLEADRKAPSETGEAKPITVSKTPKGKADYVVFGEGDLAFSFTDWLNGTAHVIVDPKGFVTIIGKITPQKEFILFKQKEYERQLFKVEIRASYGIPVVGNIFIFANVSLSAFAAIGPGKFYNIVVDGTYSTDPGKAKSFSIRGTLNVSAAAGARLRGEAGLGLEILAHDIKAGAGVNGIAGIKAYAEATPIIGYREKAAPGEDKKGEWFIRGEFEIAGQPFLGLSGDVFVEIDAPWWSPVPDKRWTWPLAGKEWPLGGSLGLGASMDYVFGSNEWPKLDLKPVEFDSSKFMTDLYADKAKSGSGKEVEQKGKWQEKNSKAADPPPKKPAAGSAKPGKGAVPPPAKSKVQPGGTKKITKPVDPNAKTAGGKSVKQYQDEAAKKGKKVPGGDLKDGKGKAGETEKNKDKLSHDEQLKQGLAALDQVTAGYTKAGATKEELQKATGAVRRKFKVFKSIEITEKGEYWNYHYVASEGDKQAAKKSKVDPKSGKDKSNPIDILWVKPDVAKYKKILIAKTVDAANRRKEALGLKKTDRLPLAELAKLKDSEKMTIGPLQSTQLEGITAGVTNNISKDIAIGYVFQAKPKQTGNDRKDKVNEVLEKHGYNRTDNLDAPTDGDHVWEKQLGGPDHENNVWPLKSEVNQESGRTVLRERKRILEQYKHLTVLDDTWLRLSRAPKSPTKP